LIVFLKKLPVLIVFILNTVLYLVFMHYFVKLYFARYIGLIFLIFVYCCWLYKYSDNNIMLPALNSEIFNKSSINTKNRYLLFTYLITVIFFMQFVAGVLTY